jgi:hypothetical protein
MKKETRLDFARQLLASDLKDIKASDNGHHLCVLGKLSDGRYFAAVMTSLTQDLSFPGKLEISKNDPKIIDIRINYCNSYDEAIWYDARWFHAVQCGYVKELIA